MGSLSAKVGASVAVSSVCLRTITLSNSVSSDSSSLHNFCGKLYRTRVTHVEISLTFKKIYMDMYKLYTVISFSKVGRGWDSDSSHCSKAFISVPVSSRGDVKAGSSPDPWPSSTHLNRINTSNNKVNTLHPQYNSTKICLYFLPHTHLVMCTFFNYALNFMTQFHGPCRHKNQL